MIKIKNQEEVLKRIEELCRTSEFRLSCGFCGGDSYEFSIAPFVLEIDGQHFIQISCTRCGYSMLFNYKILMGKDYIV